MIWQYGMMDSLFENLNLVDFKFFFCDEAF